MKIVVIGGSGLIGSKLVERLRRKGHEVVAASPASGVDTITGRGLAEALAGAQAVVDVANSPSFEDQAVLDFFETSGRNLLAAERVAGAAALRTDVLIGPLLIVAAGRARDGNDTRCKHSDYCTLITLGHAENSPLRVCWQAQLLSKAAVTETAVARVE